MGYVILSICLALVAVILAALYRYLTSKHDYFSKQSLPGPKPSFPFGTANSAWKKDLTAEDLKNVKEYGKVFGTFDGNSPNLIVADPELIQKILVDDSLKFRSRRANQVQQEFLKNCLNIIEGNDAQKENKSSAIAFTSNKFKQLVPRLQKTAETMVQTLANYAKNGGHVNISNQVRAYVIDVIALCLFGLDLNADEKIKDSFTKSLQRAFDIDNPDSPITLAKFQLQCLGSLDNFVLPLESVSYFITLLSVSLHERRKTTDVHTKAKAVDFLDLVLAGVEEERMAAMKEKADDSDKVEPVLTDEQILTQCLSVILVVSRMTKLALELSVHTLATLPQIQDKLHAEISKQIQIHAGEVSLELVENADYLDMFVGEILRMYPIEFRLERECTEDMTLGEAKLSRGDFVSVPLYALHRLEEFYPQPEQFNPERFSPSNSEKRNHYTYLPFGQAGANSSHVGVQLGVLFTKMTIVHLVESLKFSLHDGTKFPAEFVKGITGIPSPQQIVVNVEKRE